MNESLWDNTVFVILKGSGMATTTANEKFEIFIIGISIKIIKLSVLENSTVKKVSMHIKISMILKFLWVGYRIKILSSSYSLESRTLIYQYVAEFSTVWGNVFH